MKKYIVLVGIGVIVIFGIIFFNSPEKPLGFGGSGETYTYKSLTSTDASSTAATAYLVRGGAGVLGSITIASTSASQISVYDNNTGATTSATLILRIAQNTLPQTFNLDLAVTKGIVVEMRSTYNSAITVGYK